MYRSVIAPVLKLTRECSILQLFILAYFSCTLVGWFVLQLPFCQKGVVSKFDALFTAASAISTTGLVTVDVGKTFSFAGQLVVMLLVQLGGIGYMVFSSFVFLHLEQKISSFRKKIPLPTAFSWDSITRLVKQVLVYTAICELAGTIPLYFFFKDAGVENSFWSALFHSISAVCTAGFSLFSSNLEGYKNHFGINATISVLSLLGALGFTLGVDFFKRLSGNKEPVRIAARLVKPFATAVILICTLLFLWMTFKNSFGLEHLMASFFHTVSAISTSGFNTIDIRALSQLPLLFLAFLMIVGASLTGSGTNMRGTSFSTMLKLVPKFTPWSQKTLFKRAQLVISTFVHYLVVLAVSTFVLILIEEQPFLPLFFEAASALCTVGLSMGATLELSNLGKGLIILLMLLGRSGILVFGFALSSQALSWEKEEGQEQSTVK